MTPPRLPRTLMVLAAAGVAAVVLTACGASSSTSGTEHLGGAMGSSPMMSAVGGPHPTIAGPGKPASGPHDSADVAFLTQMIPHHMQAVVMAELAATRARSAQLKTLARQIRAAQTSEIVEMSGWLLGWGVSMPTGSVMFAGSMKSDSPSAGTGTGGDAMSGTPMMSGADMARLETLRGTAFDRSWLIMMTSHHESALTMARAELRAGTNADAKGLARSILTSQTAQITEMKGILAALPAS